MKGPDFIGPVKETWPAEPNFLAAADDFVGWIQS